MKRKFVIAGAVAAMLIAAMLVVTSLGSADGPRHRGCCSWHHGECGCQGGRVVCCDGTVSPTCTC